MNLKLDENLSRHLKDILKKYRHEVLTAADQGLLSRFDTEIAEAAKIEDMMLLTLDLEFADLRKYPPGNHPGIILFRPRSLGPLAVNRFIEEFVADTDLTPLKGSLVIVEPNRVRVRRTAVNLDSDG
jgi:predicted nuclease of predicted toxin-antitoxin system